MHDGSSGGDKGMLRIFDAVIFMTARDCFVNLSHMSGIFFLWCLQVFDDFGDPAGPAGVYRECDAEVFSGSSLIWVFFEFISNIDLTHI